MSVCRKITLLGVAFLALCQLGASTKDPVGWVQSGTIPVNSIQYTPYVIQYELTNNGINMPAPLQVIHHASSDEFMVTNGCLNQALPNGGKCTVTVELTPRTLGRKTFSMSIGYGYNVVNLPSIETNTTASKDPISWYQSGSIPAETKVGERYHLSYFIVSHLPFTMESPLVVSRKSTTQDFVLADGCSGQKLSLGEHCAIEINYVPTRSGKQSLDLNVQYKDFSMQLSPLETKTLSNGTPKVSVRMTQGLPRFARVAGVYDIVMLFTNSGNASADELVFTRTYPKSFTENNNTCGTSLGAGETCEVSGTFFSPTMGNATITLTMDYSGGTVSTSTSTKMVDPGLGRIITFINNCDQDVWFGARGGVADDICVDDSDCPVGSKCKPEDDEGAGVCYWPNPAPQSPRGEYQLNANGGANYIVTLDFDPEVNVIWSGDFAGRTNCIGNHCQTADCHSEGGEHECPLGIDFDKPATIARMTLVRNAADTYKVDASHGINLPLSISPTNRSASTMHPYVCGSPGAMEPSHNSLGACTWSLTPPSNDYVRVVSATPKNCSVNADCSEGDSCGLSYDAEKPAFQKTCGKKVGYWTANAACSISAEAADPYFQCKKQLSSYTLAALLSCAAPNHRAGQLNSCYTFNDSSCCGCANWDELGITVPAAPGTEVCLNRNAEWVSQVLPNLEWLKRACPTMAVYPHDDKSGVFNCQSNGTLDNLVDYTITFCPKA